MESSETDALSPKLPSFPSEVCGGNPVPSLGALQSLSLDLGHVLLCQGPVIQAEGTTRAHRLTKLSLGELHTGINTTQVHVSSARAQTRPHEICLKQSTAELQIRRRKACLPVVYAPETQS